MLLMKALCLGAMMKVQCELFSVCKQWSLHASLPSGITPFASTDADEHTTVSNALHFFDAFRNGDYSELAVWSGIRDVIIRSSDVPDSELQASVPHTLDVETGGWDCRHCCVHPRAVQGRGLSGVIGARHCDLPLLLACQTQQLRLGETPQLCPRSHGSGVLGERWLSSVIPSVSKSGLALSSLTGEANHCWALLNSWEGHPRTPQTGHSRTTASQLGKFAGQCLWCCSQGSRRSLSRCSH